MLRNLAYKTKTEALYVDYEMITDVLYPLDKSVQWQTVPMIAIKKNL